MIIYVQERCGRRECCTSITKRLMARRRIRSPSKAAVTSTRNRTRPENLQRYSRQQHMLTSHIHILDKFSGRLLVIGVTFVVILLYYKWTTFQIMYIYNIHYTIQFIYIRISVFSFFSTIKIMILNL